ncbi:MAG: hypothetical protein ACOCYV_02160 [Planctomycetota bacterium]
MFRKRTDKVYATLQQVQRRITQATDYQHDSAGGASAIPGQPVSHQRQSQSQPPMYPQPPTYPQPHAHAPPQSQASWASAPATAQPPPSAGPNTYESRPGTVFFPPGLEPREDELAANRAAADRQATGAAASEQSGPPLHPGAAIAHDDGDDQDAPSDELLPRGRIAVPQELLYVIAVLWVLTIGVAFMFGRANPPGKPDQPPTGDARSVAANDAPDGDADDSFGADFGAEFEAGGGTQPGGGAQRPEPLGDHVIVLRSVGSYSDNGFEEFAQAAERNNQAVRERYRDKLQPWFGARRPESGGLQFVYGYLGNGVYGIPGKEDEQMREQFKLLASKFDGANWKTIR